MPLPTPPPDAARAVTLWRDDSDEYRESWPCCDGMTEYRALPVAEFAALTARVDAITKERGRWMERYNGAAVMLASITADRDALAALLKEARYCVESWHDLTGHPVEADLLARIDRALSPSPAAPGTGD